MPLQPVEFDPFGEAPKGVTLKGSKGLTPVDFDPFAEDAPTPKGPLSAVKDELLRSGGRAGRTMAAGMASILDAPRIVTDPLFQNVVEFGAKELGMDGVAKFARDQYTAPTFSEQTRKAIDRATDSAYAPRNGFEQGVDIAGEVVTAFFTPSVLAKLGKGGVDLFNRVSSKIGNVFTRKGDVPPEAQRIVSVLLEEGKTPQQIMQAAEQAQKSPVPMTIFESAESPKGLALQRSLTEQPSKAGGVMQAFNRQRLEGAIPGAIQKVSGRGASTVSEYRAGQRAQEVATSLIDDAVKARTEAVRPLYLKDQAKVLPGPLIDDMAKQNPAFAAAKRSVDKNPAIQQLLIDEGVQPNTAGYLEQIRKELGQSSQNALKDITNRNAEAAKGYNSAIRKVDLIMEKLAPNIVKGRAEYAAQSPEVTKLTKGVVGRIAKVKSPEKIGEIVFREPPEVIAGVRNMYLKKDPQAWVDVTASHLSEVGRKSGTLNEYLRLVDKNEVLRADLRKALTPSQYKGHRLLVANLRKIQQGLPSNSATVPKAQAAAELNKSGALDALAGQVGDQRTYTTRGLDFVASLLRKGAGKRTALENERFARALVSPDLEALGKALARVRPGSPEAIKLIDAYMTPYLGIAGEAAEINAGHRKALPAQ